MSRDCKRTVHQILILDWVVCRAITLQLIAQTFCEGREGCAVSKERVCCEQGMQLRPLIPALLLFYIIREVFVAVCRQYSFWRADVNCFNDTMTLVLLKQSVSISACPTSFCKESVLGMLPWNHLRFSGYVSNWSIWSKLLRAISDSSGSWQFAIRTAGPMNYFSQMLLIPPGGKRVHSLELSVRVKRERGSSLQ